MKCRCGHLDWMHTKSGVCTGSVKVVRADEKLIDEGDIQLLPPNEFNLFVDGFARHETARARLKERGYVLMDCSCEIFHTLELPLMPLVGLDGQPLKKELIS